MVRRIGDGGMSVVYLARQESLKRHVALKVMRVRGDVTETMADRFIHEAETIAKLDHPNIVGIYDVGQAPDGSLYYAMPFLDHGDLRSFDYGGDEQRLVDLMVSLCEGLGYAHHHEVVHRDVKPENVLFDKFGNPQIADFGIALTAGNRRWTKEGQVIGSVDYMSPEQCQARAVDARSDLYGLGIILWELLTGEVPFEAEEEMGMMLAQVGEPLPGLPWELRHWLPLLRRCLAKAPAERFQSAEEFRAALRAMPLRPAPVFLARLRVTLGDLWRRWRRRAAIAAIGVIVLAALAAAGYFYLESQRLPQPTPQPPVETAAPVHRQPELAAPPVVEAAPEEEPETVVAPEAGPVPPPAIAAGRALELVDEALERIASDRLTLPEDDNAADRLVAVLEVHPDHPQATDALAALSNRYRQLLEGALDEARYEDALAHARSLADVWDRTGLARERFPLVVEGALHAVQRRVERELDRLHADGARSAVAVVEVVDPASPRLRPWREAIDGVPGAGEVLADGRGVDTVFVPPVLERPDGRRREIAAGFSIMASEVTVAMYRRFMEQRRWPESGCRRGELPPSMRPRSWREPGIAQNDDHPVVCVTWNDAVAYAEWLSARSGRLYRLPSEREWVHAAWIGHEADLACNTGNVAGNETAALVATPLNCDDGIVHTAPVGHFQANRLGIGDLRGNAREWVRDCAPSDTGFNQFLDRLNIKKADPCDRRTVRGTGWLDGRGESMMGLVRHEGADEARSYIGLRLVRDLVAERERERARRSASD